MITRGLLGSFKKTLMLLFSVASFLLHLNGSLASEPTTKVGIITAKAGLTLRDKPTQAAEKLFLMPYNEAVTVLETTGPQETIAGTTGNWYRIRFSTPMAEFTGWAFGGFIKIENLTPTNSATHPEQKSNQVVSTTTTEDSTPQKMNFKPIGPQIKGLQIGMDLEEALKAARAKFPNCKIKKLQEDSQGEKYRIDVDSPKTIIGSTMGIIELWGKKTQGVIFIVFYSDADIFNTGNLAFKEFAQKIMNAYAIPELQPFSVNETFSLKYSSNDGWDIQILETKVVVLVRTPNSSEQKFD